jgi:hypothetical protein
MLFQTLVAPKVQTTTAENTFEHGHFPAQKLHL